MGSGIRGKYLGSMERAQTLRYDVEFKPKAVKDIEGLPSRIRGRIPARIEEMGNNLKGKMKSVSPDIRIYHVTAPRHLAKIFVWVRMNGATGGGECLRF